MIKKYTELKYLLFKDETSLNGYYHLVQKKLHGTHTKHSYVGLKDYHIQKAIDNNLPLMIHLCPDVDLSGTGKQKRENLSKCSFKDQTEVMIIPVKDLQRFRSTKMQESKSKDKQGNIRKFSSVKYEVWHYSWYPDYITGKGIINKKISPEDEGLGI